MKTGFIYELIDPITNLTRYIGQTRSTPEKRFSKHKYKWKRIKGKLSYLDSWIKSLYCIGNFPIVNVIEDNIPLEDLNYKEIQYIKLYKSFGANLTNCTIGGSEIPEYTYKEEWKIKRLNSLKSSILWKEGRERHKKIIQDYHNEGIRKIGFKYLSKEKQEELRGRAMNKWRKKVASIDECGNIIESFDSIKKAAEFYKIKETTHIVRVCKGKSKSGITHGFRFKYL